MALNEGAVLGAAQCILHDLDGGYTPQLTGTRRLVP